MNCELRCNMNKAELRLQMKKYRPDPDETWVKGLAYWSVLQEAKTVFCFLSLPDEPDTMPLIHVLLESGKRVCIPKCIDASGNMDAVVFENDIVSDALGIRTTKGTVVSPKEIDLILVPGLAFDSKGHRLGRGKGYYDRFLAEEHSLTCGICPAMRFLSSVPTEAHDCAVDFVFTPYGLYKTNDK